MNNSKIAFDNLDDEQESRLPNLKEEQGKLAQIVEAINRVESSDDWQKLKKLLLDGVVTALERQLTNEATKKQVDESTIYRLQGQLAWARKYADLKKLGEFFRQQVENIKNQIHAKENPRDGAR